MINRIPRSVTITATATGIIVSGSGTPEVNGKHTENGTENVKPRYYFDGGDQNLQKTYWGGSSWIIRGDGLISVRYVSTENVATPDLCVVWNVVAGAPAPSSVVAG